MFIFGIAGGLYGGSLNNFLAEILGIGRFERGIVEFFRELPGLLLFVLLAFLYRIPENRIIRLAFFFSFMGMLGLAAAAHVPWVAVGFIVLWSTGEHVIMPARQSISIHAALPGKEGLAMGLTRSAGNVGMVLGFYLVSFIFLILPGMAHALVFRVVFAAGALFTLAGLLFTFRLGGHEGHVKRPRLNFQKKFTKYYILEMFFGARKQVFLTFAPYVLILTYGASIKLIATLYGIYSLANIFMNPLVGKLVDGLGYKKVLILDSALLVLLCLLYGFAGHLFPPLWAFRVVCLVFVLDSILFSAMIARSVYVKTLSRDRDEVTSTLSTGISVNHFISVIIALLGGLLWKTMGVEMLFSAAALFGLASMIFTLTLPSPADKKVLEGKG